ncbi:acetyl-CoA carboxylase family protein [Ramlibacter albus]|uniref:acetyl-CoA carboxylase n=1 Tax=Ramlibacter albus TaxID=2079448 RepID=A0A923MCV8_9BURK|nr:carboxyl transferase domain-containing protein [Ramlibacter albus]MBC5767064.1 carbamoyl-phosphate synthase large subunit [Ramlibacter albus]
MASPRLLIANRGEIALRIARAAQELQLPTVTVHSADDAKSPHRFAADQSVALQREGAAAYLDIDAIVRAAVDTGCTLVHPGYGFLSENAAFAAACERAGLTFVGPSPEVLELFGDKARARAFAREQGVALARGTAGPTSLEDMRGFFAALPAGSSAMVKAVAGGGGRGMRRVESAAQLDAAFARCSSEAAKAFGQSALYIEQYVAGARHIEVQVVGDGRDYSHVGERDCSVQQRHQKVVEVAPAPALGEDLRAKLQAAALRMARACRLRGLCTFEFLVAGELEGGFVFMEANPRLQVEHTVTEEVYGLDLVRAQIAIAMGETLAAVGLAQPDVGAPRGFAIQYRITLEGAAEAGTVTRFDVPTGRGVRVETFLHEGATPGTAFDPLLAKLIVHSHAPQFATAADKGARVLREFRLGGIATNLGLLDAIAADASFRAAETSTRYLESNLDRLVQVARQRTAERASELVRAASRPEAQAATAEDDDPSVVRAPTRGTVLEIAIAEGARMRQGDALCVLEAMKMEHVVTAPFDGVVAAVQVAPGELVDAGRPLFLVEPGTVEAVAETGTEREHAGPRMDLQEVLDLRRLREDEGRPAVVAQRHAKGMRTARENIHDLCDPGTFVEYGGAAVGARHGVAPLDELRRTSPADGFIYGHATVNGGRCFVASYDYSVHAGTQGFFGHKKHDRLFQLAEDARRPVVIFTEGGGGRPTEPNNVGGANLATATFFSFARLSGLVPLVGIVAGRCFAGNAALLGCCDVVIATRDATVGMGGPVMIEGAGLGVYPPEQVGPAAMHAKTGVVDILVEDEAQAVRAAKQYLGYFQGPVAGWKAADPAVLRGLIPDRRTRAYDMRKVIAALADEESVLELRAQFAPGAITALVRVEGRPLGLIANNPAHNAGAVCAAEADKFTRFAKLCDAHGLPVLSLCDTPGIMVGPDAEQTAIVRHSSRMLVAAANLTVPWFTVVLRKAYGLGAMAMGGGSFHHGSFFAVAWPTAEFGGMGLEGQVRLGHRRELEQIADPQQRAERFRDLVDRLYQHGKATRYAPFLVIDEVIDPAETRGWLLAGLDAARPRRDRSPHKYQPGVDPW